MNTLTINNIENKEQDFFTNGTKYRCMRTVINDKGVECFTAGKVYDQHWNPTAHYGWLTNNQGHRHAWPQPCEVSNECENFDDLTAEDIDPRNYFEAVA